MMDKELPILAPLGKLFQSRKFILALTVIIVAVITHLAPDLSKYADVLTNITLFVFGALFLHLSAEDIITLRANLPTSLNQAEKDAASEAADTFTASAVATIKDGAAG